MPAAGRVGILDDMEQAPPSRRRYTVEEYLRLEAAAADRHEYRDGEILAMGGAATTHVRLSTNLTRRLAERLEGTGCEVLGSDQRVRARQTRYCYPDLTVACQPLIYDPPDGEVVLINPRVVIEILSPSTESSDRGEKFTSYRELASLQEYLLVAQDRPRVEPFYCKADGEWTIGKVVEGLEAVLRVRCLGIEIPLGQIYAGVTFPPPPPAAPPSA